MESEVAPPKKTTKKNRSGPAMRWLTHLLVFFVIALVLFTILAVFVELPSDVHMNLWSLLVGGTLVTTAATVFLVNLDKRDDDRHVAVAPYSGAQKTNSTLSKVVNGVLFIMGLVVLSFPLFM